MPGYIQPVANHLWQSTLFAAAVWPLAQMLHRNRASVRYRLWLAASLKFLLPFALLVAAGRQIEWRSGPPPATNRPIANFVASLEQPLLFQAATSSRSRTPLISEVAELIWLVGALSVGLAWVRRWRDIRVTIRAADPVPSQLPIPVLETATGVEPGVAGIFRPALLLPAGIRERLTPQQLAAVMEHEMCHVRRRDNLAVALHAVVETLFWFHPLVWWIRQRLMEERERAVDEEVVRRGSSPETYAEGILNVCRFYVESPACVSGVTGADLKKRIEGIMSQKLIRELDPARRVLLAVAAAIAIAAPLVIGILHVPLLDAQDAGVKFEVASVKLNTTADLRGTSFQTQPGGRLVSTGVPLYMLIEFAYGQSMQSVRMSGGPSWIRETRYDIDARAAQGAIPSDLPAVERQERMRPMLQNLLADRFHLVVRRENKEMPVYLVSVAKGGLKIEKSKVDEKSCGPDVPCHGFQGGQGRGVHGKSANIGDLLSFVENWSDRPMIDRTGVTGLYNMDSDGWVPLRGPGGGNEGLEDPVRPTLFTVFERQLGLKVEPGKAVVETYVIDHVEKPVEN